MLSQLVDANITNIGGIGSNWTGTYTYKANGDMVARKINKNPMRWLVYLTVLGLALGISRIHLDMSRSSSNYTIWGISIGKLLSINPLAPLNIIFAVLFLWLYAKKSKYAWHAIFIPFLLFLPLSFVFSVAGIYFRYLENVYYAGFLIAIWVAALTYLIILRPQYNRFLSSCDTITNEKPV